MADLYIDMARLAEDTPMNRRVAACVAQQGYLEDAGKWAWDNRYAWASTPAWAERYATSADSVPGETSITDGDILSRVQQMYPGA